MPADTFGIALGVPQGADHHLSAGQAVGGVQIAQVALGIDFTGFDDLEKVRNGVRTLRSQESRLPALILPALSVSLPLPEGRHHKFSLVTQNSKREAGKPPVSPQSTTLSPMSLEGIPIFWGPSHVSVDSVPSADSCEHLVQREGVQWNVERKP